jgi:uncharacterized protein YxjI
MGKPTSRFICLDKNRDKNGNIVSYALQDSFNNHGKVWIVEKDKLKQLIINGNIYIDNLKLTSDHRLIDRAGGDHDDDFKDVYWDKHYDTQKGPIRITPDDIKTYQVMNGDQLCSVFENHGANKNQISYLRYKFNKSKDTRDYVGQHMKKALIIGLCAASLVGAGKVGVNAIGNSYNNWVSEVSSESTIDTSSELGIDEASTVDSSGTEVTADDKVSYADKSIYVDYKISPIVHTTEVYVGNEKVATMRFGLSVLDKLTLEDSDGNTIVNTSETLISATRTYNLYDESGNIKYKMKKNIMKHGIIKENYSIYDADGNEIAYIKEDNVIERNLTGKRDTIYDASTDEVIATMESNTYRDDYTLTINDSSKISNKYLVILSRQYRSSTDTSNSQKSSSNKNYNSSKSN